MADLVRRLLSSTMAGRHILKHLLCREVSCWQLLVYWCSFQLRFAVTPGLFEKRLELWRPKKDVHHTHSIHPASWNAMKCFKATILFLGSTKKGFMSSDSGLENGPFYQQIHQNGPAFKFLNSCNDVVTLSVAHLGFSVLFRRHGRQSWKQHVWQKRKKKRRPGRQPSRQRKRRRSRRRPSRRRGRNSGPPARLTPIQIRVHRLRCVITLIIVLDAC